MFRCLQGFLLWALWVSLFLKRLIWWKRSFAHGFKDALSVQYRLDDCRTGLGQAPTRLLGHCFVYSRHAESGAWIKRHTSRRWCVNQEPTQADSVEGIKAHKQTVAGFASNGHDNRIKTWNDWHNHINKAVIGGFLKKKAAFLQNYCPLIEKTTIVMYHNKSRIGFGNFNMRHVKFTDFTCPAEIQQHHRNSTACINSTAPQKFDCLQKFNCTI